MTNLGRENDIPPLYHCFFSQEYFWGSETSFVWVRKIKILDNQQDFAAPNTSALHLYYYNKKQLLVGPQRSNDIEKWQWHCQWRMMSDFDIENISQHPEMVNERIPLTQVEVQFVMTIWKSVSCHKSNDISSSLWENDKKHCVTPWSNLMVHALLVYPCIRVAFTRESLFEYAN